MTAYDYEHQRWVTGGEAIAIHIAQLEIEHDMLAATDAEEYLDWQRRNGDPKITTETALAWVDARLADLRSEVTR